MLLHVDICRHEFGCTLQVGDRSAQFIGSAGTQNSSVAVSDESHQKCIPHSVQKAKFIEHHRKSFQIEQAGLKIVNRDIG